MSGVLDSKTARKLRGFAMIDALTAIALAALAFSALLETRALSFNISSVAKNETEALLYAQTLLDEGTKQNAGALTRLDGELRTERSVSDYFPDGVLDPRFEEVVVIVDYRKRRQIGTITLRSLRAKDETNR